MKRNHLIGLSLILIISVGCGYWITKTERYKNYRQLQFLETVVDHTLDVSSYNIQLQSYYNLLGYEMNLEGNGTFSQHEEEAVLSLNYLMKLNGKGVSPMTVELNQYVDLAEHMKYMNLNHGQWFKESSDVSLTVFNQIPKQYRQSKLQMSDDYIEVIEDNEQLQVIAFQLPFHEADFLSKELISNILSVSDSIQFESLLQNAENLNYKVTINKKEKQILKDEVDNIEGCQKLIQKIMDSYSNLASQISQEEIQSMTFRLSADLTKSTDNVSIPSEVRNQAIHISDLK